MATKGYSTAGVLRHFTSISPVILGAFLALGISACAPKNQDKTQPSEVEEQVIPDESIKHSDIQGILLLESVTKNKKVIFQTDKGGFVTTDAEAKNLFGGEIDKSAKAIIAFRITDNKLQMMVFANGNLRGKTEDEYRFDKAKLQVDYNGNKDFNSRQIILQKSGTNFLMAEKSWRMIVRKISEQELADLLKKPLELPEQKAPETPTAQGGSSAQPSQNTNSTNTSPQSQAQTQVPQQPKPAPQETNELKDVANQLIRVHEALYSKSILSTFDSKLEGLQPNELRGFKEQVERAITNSELIYDSKSDTLGHIIYQNELQCYSGTTLLIVSALKKFSPEQWENLNMVAIHTSGHVLPGFVVSESGKFRLYGIEMTTSDDGLVDFGITDQIKTPIRVVDALNWAKIEGNPNKSQPGAFGEAQKIMEATHKKYQIPLLPVPPLKDESGRSKLGSSPLTFGTIPPDKRVRRTPKSSSSANYGNSAASSQIKAQTQQAKNSATHESTYVEIATKQAPQASNQEGWAVQMIEKKSLSACEQISEILTKEKWLNMEFDISKIYDINTNAPITEADLKSRNLNTTIGFVRPNVKFSLDIQAKLLYYTYLNEEEVVTKRAFKIMRDDSTCVVGMDSSNDLAPELRDFASGVVAIEFAPEKFKIMDGLKFNVIWKNQFFKQSGYVYLN